MTAFLLVSSIFAQDREKVILYRDLGDDIDESKKPNSSIGMYINEDEFIKRIMKRYLNQNFYRNN